MSNRGEERFQDREPRWIEVGVVGKAHGLQGEVYVWPYEDGDSILQATKVRLRRGSATIIKDLERVRRIPKALLVKLQGVDDREAARRLTGFTVYVDRGEFPELEEGEFYYADLIGGTVVGPEKEPLGVIEGIEWHGADFIYFDWQGHGRVALPMIDELVERVTSSPPQVVLKTLEIEGFILEE